MQIPSNKVLAKIAVYGSVVCISAVMYVRSKIQYNIRDSEHFRAALTTLRTHSGAVHLLGEPIKENGFDLADTNRNFCNEQQAQFEVNVKGPKDKGILFYWANRDVKAWNINRVELELKSQPDRRMIIKKTETASNSES